ncbi:D-isomer specific 2-hydroxyacid dehydrogenase family protein [Pseudomonas abieticivorans]|uniref:D-isomer specific 2-hydroxyacid dehydrogenase family protein n=1 Tax=Pseudomonas abieticivorans TaxID=2931382 RepID=UPI0020C00A8D|nr:D-isomer specific 2-hydroxyacid dehydrogenase family protein [Pseudomonas sp. PIA16]
MSPIVIASQLDEPFNQALRTALQPRHPGAQVIGVPPGVPSDLPAQVNVLLARPINVRGFQAPETPPPGWPYGLKWVQLASSGIDFYPRWLFDGPPVTTARGSASGPIAEFALAAIFAAAKHLPDIWVHDDTWNFTALTPVQGTTLGILGFGSIGQSLASKAQALGLNVVALRQSNAPLEVDGVEAARDIHDLFARADHLVIAAPLTPATRHLVNRDVLASAKPGLHLINIARGGLLDQQALLQALDNGQVGLASLDVSEPEPLPAGHPLYSHPRVRLSPHTSAISTRSSEAITAIFLDNLERYLCEQPLHNLADTTRGY